MNDGQLRQLYPLIPLGLCVLDEGLHILEANAHFEETFGAPGQRIFPEFVCECIGEPDVKACILQGRNIKRIEDMISQLYVSHDLMLKDKERNPEKDAKDIREDVERRISQGDIDVLLANYGL